ncbi:tape measure protein, partial [Mesorhizobium sp. M7A.F.Ca.AU.001.01.1.1]|uniref:tape measure protein n=1 Tax=Mesorhizobium sp. M7A.F.Ca.AU.001.01.1.1 TaxID=2496675 RepID=UPI0013E38266
MLATTAVFGGLTAALSSNLVLRYADTYNNLTNQIRVVSDDAADLAGQLAAVQAAADNSRSSLQSTAVLYSRLAKAAPTKSNSDVLDYVQTIQKALALGGATAQEAASAAIQFSQAIASNRLGGEELRAVLETPLGLALAKGLDVTIGKLRQMSIAGELTADRVLGALEKIKGGIDQQFSKSILTIDQSLIKADNQLTAYIGTLDKTYGLTRIVSGGILGFANNIDKVAGSAVALGLALGSAFAGRLAGRGIGKAVDSTFGEVSRRAADARDQVQKLTKAQHDLAQELDRGTRALGSLKGRDNIEFASKSDVKILQREEAKLNKIREDRLATTTRLRDAVSAANAVEVKSSKSTIASANKIVETQSKIEDSLARQTTLTNELQKAETRLTAAKGQQTLNVANIGAVKEAEKDITKIRQAQIAETTKAAQLEDAVGTQRIALAAKIGDAEAKAAEQKAKFQAIAQTASKQTAKLLTEEFDQTQRLGRARAAIGEVGGIGKAAEVRGAEAALGGLRQGLEDTSQSLASAVRGTSVLRQSFGLLKTGAASLVGFLGGPWGVAFTGAIALTTLLGIRSAEAAQQAENTKKALKDVLGDIANAGGGQGQIAQDSLHTDELKGQLDEKKNQIDLFTAGLKTQAGTIENVLIRIFDPTLNPALAGNSKFADLFGSATAGINNLIKRVGVGEVQLSGINRELRALPEAKFIDDDQISKLTVAVSEAAKLQLALNRVNNQASQLKTTLSSGVGSINVEAEINRAGQQSADALELYEASLKASRKTAQGLLFDLQNINDETSLESDIRKGTAAIMKDNKDLLEGEAREIAIVNTVLDLINSKSEAWWRSSEATKGEVAQILAMAKQIAPEMKFDKPDATTSQLAAIDDMINGQVQANKHILDRRGLIGHQQSLL